MGLPTLNISEFGNDIKQFQLLSVPLPAFGTTYTFGLDPTKASSTGKTIILKTLVLGVAQPAMAYNINFKIQTFVGPLTSITQAGNQPTPFFFDMFEKDPNAVTPIISDIRLGVATATLGNAYTLINVPISTTAEPRIDVIGENAFTGPLIFTYYPNRAYNWFLTVAVDAAPSVNSGLNFVWYEL